MSSLAALVREHSNWHNPLSALLEFLSRQRFNIWNMAQNNFEASRIKCSILTFSPLPINLLLTVSMQCLCCDLLSLSLLVFLLFLKHLCRWVKWYIYVPRRRGGGHIVFGADPVGVGGSVGVGISVTLSCLHDISWTGGWILTKFVWM